jgi:hypothetical protein
MPARQVGVSIGFRGETSVFALLHELGHLHGRRHAPCDATADLDPAFPDPRGEVGVWGYDALTDELTPPSRKDLMGYCGPRWISPYTQRALPERRAGRRG